MPVNVVERPFAHPLGPCLALLVHEQKEALAAQAEVVLGAVAVLVEVPARHVALAVGVHRPHDGESPEQVALCLRSHVVGVDLVHHRIVVAGILVKRGHLVIALDGVGDTRSLWHAIHQVVDYGRIDYVHGSISLRGGDGGARVRSHARGRPPAAVWTQTGRGQGSRRTAGRWARLA